MEKPKNYDNVRAGGEFEPVQIGAHKAVIRKVLETKSSTGRPMIVVYIDFAREDVQPGYFGALFEGDTRDDRKWPFQGTQYILTEDPNGDTSRSFKGFCTAYEDSNGLSVNWGGGDAWADQFAGRKIGAVFGEVEEEYNDGIKTRRRIRWFCDVHKTEDQSIPQKKLLNNARQQGRASSPEFMPIPDTDAPPFWS